MPRHYFRNDRAMPNAPSELDLWEEIDLGKGVFITPSMPKYKPYLSGIIGTFLCENAHLTTVLKGIIENNSKASHVIVSEREQEAVQGHIKWYWI